MLKKAAVIFSIIIFAGVRYVVISRSRVPVSLSPEIDEAVNKGVMSNISMYSQKAVSSYILKNLPYMASELCSMPLTIPKEPKRLTINSRVLRPIIIIGNERLLLLASVSFLIIGLSGIIAKYRMLLSVSCKLHENGFKGTLFS